MCILRVLIPGAIRHPMPNPSTNAISANINIISTGPIMLLLSEAFIAEYHPSNGINLVILHDYGVPLCRFPFWLRVQAHLILDRRHASVLKYLRSVGPPIWH